MACQVPGDCRSRPARLGARPPPPSWALPTVDDIATFLDVSVDDVLSPAWTPAPPTALSLVPPASADSPAVDDDALDGRSSDLDPGLERLRTRPRSRPSCRTYLGAGRTIVYLRFWSNMTQLAIAGSWPGSMTCFTCNALNDSASASGPSERASAAGSGLGLRRAYLVGQPAQREA